MEEIVDTFATKNTDMERAVVLLVDDNEDILDFISDDLEEKYHVLQAKDGKEAFSTLQREAVQLIISDVMMPEMDGFEFCAKVKSTLEFSHIPVILLTAKIRCSLKLTGLELGADAYVEKPFSPEFLQVQISSLLKNRNKIKEYFSSSPPPSPEKHGLFESR
ncbi:response regulator transcription factor [Pedobacter terrae]|uniref:response regulator transcription factor n=1 Tax=Pedobacter terrae TaxID=405671 RepID=UPI002FF96220